MQVVVPNGASLGGAIGSILSGTKGQMRGAQIGVRSIELSQSGTTAPPTHAQTHSAFAGRATKTNATAKHSLCFISCRPDFAIS
jgi:hypothetical protein